ncbi:MAG: DUF817 domain-containing protein [Pseudomonadota bacterium]
MKTDSRVDAVLNQLLPPLERKLLHWLPQWAVEAGIEFLVFGIKQAWACLFGGFMLIAILITHWVWPEASPLTRYDFLLLYALSLQGIFLVTGLERPQEAIVICLFHAVGTTMEIFKVHMGSWFYPEDSLFQIGNVPLFSGFMYACVGSYFARVSRVFDFSFTHYPPRLWTMVLAVLIYVNFFTHHFGPDIRWVLFLATALLFGRTQVHYRVWRWQHHMPLLLGFFLVSLFIWGAENISTLSQIWLYPDQQSGWKIVSFQKMGSWFLLMLISWGLVTLVHPPKIYKPSRQKEIVSG